jgi:small ligand-binding sensory domain FIST
MQFAASHNRIDDSQDAVMQVCRSVREKLGSAADLGVLFVSRDHAGFTELPVLINELLGCRQLIGCTAETVVGGAEEIESGPALSLWAATLPGVQLRSFQVRFARTPDGLVCDGLPDPHAVTNPGAVLFLGDPYTCAVDSVISRFADELPGLPLLGGMASAASAPGENALYVNGETVHRGGVGVLIGGAVSVRSVVSQGCRPVGPPLVITRSERNIVRELGGQPAMLRLQEVFDAASERDQFLLQRGPHVGLVINEYQDQFERGDFLIANVIGGDRDTGALQLGNVVRMGQTVRFHVRDAQTADEDLRELLSASLNSGPSPAGALLFSCNGRGTRLFPQPNHDAGVIQELAGPLPLAGFFAQGELGPVGGANHLHGFTASVALFAQ